MDARSISADALRSALKHGRPGRAARGSTRSSKQLPTQWARRPVSERIRPCGADRFRLPLVGRHTQSARIEAVAFPLVSGSNLRGGMEKKTRGDVERNDRGVTTR